MRGAETFKALAEGKIVHFPGTGIKYKLNADGIPYCKWDDRYTWELCESIRHGLWEDECEVVDEFDLSFKDAMQAAINGHRIAHETFYKDIYFFDDKGRLCTDHEDYGRGDFLSLYKQHVTGKWKVVE